MTGPVVSHPEASYETYTKGILPVGEDGSFDPELLEGFANRALQVEATVIPECDKTGKLLALRFEKRVDA